MTMNAMPLPSTVTVAQIEQALATLGFTDLAGFQAVVITRDSLMLHQDGGAPGSTDSQEIVASDASAGT